MGIEQEIRAALSDMSPEDEFRITIVLPPVSDTEDGREEA